MSAAMWVGVVLAYVIVGGIFVAAMDAWLDTNTPTDDIVPLVLLWPIALLVVVVAPSVAPILRVPYRLTRWALRRLSATREAGR